MFIVTFIVLCHLVVGCWTEPNAPSARAHSARRLQLAPDHGDPMRFFKYHGLGNDFIILASACPTPALARALCARGHAIGADGLMRAAPATHPAAALRMDLINSDGSLPDMCGNALRCLVKYAVDELHLHANPLPVETPVGVLSCAWQRAPSGTVATVSVAMGAPHFEATAIPFDIHFANIHSHETYELITNNQSFIGTPVTTGNPHFVIFDDPDLARVRRDGPLLEVHPALPAKANIEFVSVLAPDHLRVTVWERGCGLTQACGTGATAAAAVAVRSGRCTADLPITVDLPGGSLLITIASDFSAATMVGPASLVYRGELEQDFLDGLERDA